MTNKEKRLQRKMQKLGSPNPQCSTCGETDARALEKHHIRGAHDGETILVCRNCHAKLGDEAQDWPKSLLSKSRSDLEKAVAFFLGLSSVLILLGLSCGKHALTIYKHFKGVRENEFA